MMVTVRFRDDLEAKLSEFSEIESRESLKNWLLKFAENHHGFNDPIFVAAYLAGAMESGYDPIPEDKWLPSINQAARAITISETEAETVLHLYGDLEHAFNKRLKRKIQHL